MSFSLLIFPPSPDAKCALTRMDDGLVVEGKPAAHPGGRAGQAFEIPADTLNGHGVVIKVVTTKSVTEDRGTLWLKAPNYPWGFGAEKNAAFEKDDFREPEIVRSARSGVVRLA